MNERYKLNISNRQTKKKDDVVFSWEEDLFCGVGTCLVATLNFTVSNESGINHQY